MLGKKEVFRVTRKIFSGQPRVLPESNLAFFVSKYSFLDARCMVMEPK